MPASVVVGGQFGSEGKGKIALEIVRRDPSCAAVVRVGGTNSGHTAIDKSGRTRVLRQLPASGIDGNAHIILPPGAYVDPEIFKREFAELGLTRSQVTISPMARIITREHREWESESQLGAAIGSTQSGTGASVLAASAREAINFPLKGMLAEHVEELVPYLGDTTQILRGYLNKGQRVVIEGSQGFGLSVLHGGFWPKATARDTSAAGFISEAGLSPLDVDDVTMVIRCHPIRVAGDSGPLAQETTWEEITRKSGSSSLLEERTTVTKKIRRIGKFDAELVRRAIAVNCPTRIALNHLDYVDCKVRGGQLTPIAKAFVSDIELRIGRKVDWYGTGASATIDSDFANVVSSN